MVWRSPEDSGFEHQPHTSKIKHVDKFDIKINIVVGLLLFVCICILGVMGWLLVSLIIDQYPNVAPSKYEVESKGHTYWSDDVVFNSDGSIWFKPIDSDEHIYIKGIYKVTVYDVDDEEGES
jgi:hypothetical protein